MTNEYYSEFIEKAFIKPIRSVLIVDDDYPTFDEILSAPINSEGHLEITSGKRWHQSQKHIWNVIKAFRSSNRPLLVDIHDGTDLAKDGQANVTAHLHQTDLLILDYELDKSRQGDGTQAVEIIRSLMKNDHFNLVIVHTRESLDNVFNAILVGLMAPHENILSDTELTEAQTLVEEIEDDNDGFIDQILNTVATEQYFDFRRCPKYLRKMGMGKEPYSAFKSLYDSSGCDRNNASLIFKYALKEHENGLLNKMNINSDKELSWSNETNKWIRSDSVFIAFSQKSSKLNLLTELQSALNDWNPHPSRLFLTMLRAEMDELGVVAQSHALDNKYALAHWYHHLLSADGSEQRWDVSKSVSRHSDQLLSTILPRVERFATDLVNNERMSDDAGMICKNHFKVDLTNVDIKRKAEREHFVFVCSKKPEGWHLRSGHVFVMQEKYWVCLSPACDMVPSQIPPYHKDAFGNKLPFIAVKLSEVSNYKEIKTDKLKRYVFLRIDTDMKSFSFAQKNDSKPEWHLLYANNKGEFENNTFNLFISQAEQGATRLVFNRHQATVVSQIRYEYTLNLIQKLGISMTRVGLDFV